MRESSLSCCSCAIECKHTFPHMHMCVMQSSDSVEADFIISTTNAAATQAVKSALVTAASSGTLAVCCTPLHRFLYMWLAPQTP